MRGTSALSLFCGLYAALCLCFAAFAQAPAGVWTSPALGLRPGQSLAGALESPFETPFEVTLSAPIKGTAATLRSCRDYLPVERMIYSAGPAAIANVLRAEGSRCDALDLLRSARPAKRLAFANFSFQRASVKELPPGLALLPSDEQQRVARDLAERGGSLFDLEKKVVLRAKSRNQAELSTGDWTATLTVWGRGDFLGDGREELLLWRNAAALGGTLRSSRVFLLVRPQGDGPLRVVRERP